MLDQQIEAFASRERFLHAVLGLVAWTTRIEALAAIPAARDRPIADRSLTDFFLGFVSLGRSMRATISCARQGTPARQMNWKGDVPLDPPTEPRILR